MSVTRSTLILDESKLSALCMAAASVAGKDDAGLAASWLVYAAGYLAGRSCDLPDMDEIVRSLHSNLDDGRIYGEQSLAMQQASEATRQ